MTCHLGEIFLVKCQKQAFSFNKREAKVYCYILFKNNFFLVSCMPAGGVRVPAQHAKIPWLDPRIIAQAKVSGIKSGREVQ
jgi:hypothetical protein